MQKGRRYAIYTIIALILCMTVSVGVYYAFPTFQPFWVQIELAGSIFASLIALYWATYGVDNGLFIVDKSKSTLKTIEKRIEPLIGSFGDKLLEFENLWATLTPQQREGVKAGMLTALDLLEGKLKQLVLRNKTV